MFQQTKKYLQERMTGAPAVGVVLGSGLGDFADELDDRTEIPYSEIPGWPRSTAVGHAGKLVFGRLSGVDLVVLSGRAHLYEGYSAARVAYGTRVLHLLGVKTLALTCAAGGVNVALKPGELVMIADHINLQGTNPLVGANEDDFGPRFPDMSDAYAAALRTIAQETAAQLDIALSEGVYAGLLGPSYETPAEIRYLRAIGADLVGMSTVPETIVANHAGMKVFAIACVTNMAAGVLAQKIDHNEVLETGQKVRGTLVKLFRELLPKLDAEARRGPAA